ncbi:MAG: T9SS type A sorting domain-containing protein [Bacteroidia bacterium]|nr:T9SS type A sorting domain-containing protein [Bacteroidia bacterium]
MKKIYLSLFCVAAFSAANAQFSLTSANIPVSGDVDNYYLVDTNSVSGPGPTGTGNTYLLGMVTPIMPMGGKNYVLPSTTPYSADFPTSQVALSDSGAFTFYSGGTTMYQMDGLGINTTAITATVTLSDKGIIFNAFPFGYGATQHDTLSGAITTTTFGSGTVEGYINTTVDGSGDIILPAGTFTNVIRVKMETYMDLSLAGGLFVVTQTETRYMFFSATSKFPLFECGRTIQVGISDVAFASINSLASAVGVNENSNAVSFNLFPSPAKNELNVKMKLPKENKVSIEVINQLGQVVRSEKMESLTAGNLVKKIDLTGVASGVYFVRLRNNDFTKVEKFIVE